jgi:hypothetical protein
MALPAERRAARASGESVRTTRISRSAALRARIEKRTPLLRRRAISSRSARASRQLPSSCRTSIWRRERTWAGKSAPLGILIKLSGPRLAGKENRKSRPHIKRTEMKTLAFFMA